jgi:ATP-dependent Clp protease ATP-binding subunit ClpA
VFERFTKAGSNTTSRALDAARRLGAEQVEPEHLLLALAEGDADPAARALHEIGVDGDAVAEAIEQDLVAALEAVGVPASVLASTPVRPRGDRPGFSAQAKRALELAVREALRRGDRRIGTEHVLLALLRRPGLVGGRVLARLGVDCERLAALVQVEAAACRR